MEGDSTIEEGSLKEFMSELKVKAPIPVLGGFQLVGDKWSGNVDLFWKHRRDEYLVGLRDMHRFNITPGGRGHYIAPGDIVLVHDEAYPRTYWRLGKVERLIKGHDEQIRAAVVRVASRSGTTTLKRPVQLLCPLEVNNSDHAEAEYEPLRRGAE